MLLYNFVFVLFPVIGAGGFGSTAPPASIAPLTSIAPPASIAPLTWIAPLTSIAPLVSTAQGTATTGGSDPPGGITAVRQDELQDRIIPGYTGVHVRSLVDCIALCGENLDCMSFFYQSVSSTCYLHDIVYVSRNDTEASENTLYYIVGVEKDCPLYTGYIHKRSFKFCWLIVTEAKSTSDATRTCIEKQGRFGFSYSPQLAGYIVQQLMGSSNLRQRKYWNGLKYDENTAEFLFHDGTPPEFTTTYGNTLPAAGEAGLCMDSDYNNALYSEVIPCSELRAFSCDYVGDQIFV